MPRPSNVSTLSLLLPLLFTPMALQANDSSQPIVRDEENIFQKIDLYRTPAVPTPSPGDRQKNCIALEQEIASLQPQTYSYKPGFYDDPYQGTSVWVGTTLFMPAYALSGYLAYLQYQENARVISAEERIEVLRHLKARHHCFES
ncbi:MAG: hypothetical protein OQL28_12230 [Sedimenticola sp.]|nr:hypothetical protein [Sedimenticola sp.]